MDCHNAAATGEELHQILPLVADLDVPSLLRMKDEDIGLIKLLLGWEFEATFTLHTASIEHGHPFLEELREIVRPWAVGFFASADEDAQWLRRE